MNDVAIFSCLYQLNQRYTHDRLRCSHRLLVLCTPLLENLDVTCKSHTNITPRKIAVEFNQPRGPLSDLARSSSCPGL